MKNSQNSAQNGTREVSKKREGLFGPDVFRAVRIAAARYAPRGEVDDAEQEAWVRILEKAPQFRGESKPGTWAFRVARSAVLNYWRRLSRDPIPVTSLGEFLDDGLLVTADELVPDPPIPRAPCHLKDILPR